MAVNIGYVSMLKHMLEFVDLRGCNVKTDFHPSQFVGNLLLLSAICCCLLMRVFFLFYSDIKKLFKNYELVLKFL